ncbi:MAG: TonB-dependent receptor [Candidatus Kapaibacteriota bacterium]
MKSYILCFLVLFCIGSKLFAYELVGFVFDSTSRKPLVGATIRLEGTNFGSLTNKDGKFVLSKVPKGKYTLIVSYVGYQTSRSTVYVPSRDTLVFYMLPRLIETNELVVSASKKLQTVQEVPVSVAFVGQEIFSRKNYVRLDEALRFVSGVVVNKDNINIRGSSGFSFGVGSRVSYLIDGVPMLSGDNADAKYDIVPPEAIANVEIVKGAGSSLYGSSAIGGVINVITKEPGENVSYSIKLQSGIYTKPKYKQWIYTDKLTTKSVIEGFLSENFGLFKLLLSGNFVKDESYRQFDKSTRFNIFGKITKELKNYGKATLLGFFSSDKRNDWVYWNSLDSATQPPTGTDLSRYLVSDKGNVSFLHKFIVSTQTFADFKSSLYYTSLDNKLNPKNPEYRQSKAFSFNNELQLNTHFGDNTLVSYGVNYQRNWVESNIYGKHKQNLFSLFSQVEFSKFYNSTITIGGRFDVEKSDSSKQYLEFSPKFGLNYLLSESNSIRFSIGRGFRSPSLAERFATIKYSGFEVVPNYDLRSEYSWSTEFGALCEFKRFIIPFLVDFSLFYSYFNDLIEPSYKIIQDKPLIRFENISKARILGFEISFKTNLFNQIPFFVGFTYLDPKDLRENKILKYRSKYTLISSVTLPYRFLSFTFDFRYISKIQRLDDMLSLQVKDYDAIVPIYVVDVNLNFDLMHFKLPFTVNLSVQNLFDYYYVEMVGNLAPTRLVSLRLQYTK